MTANSLQDALHNHQLILFLGADLPQQVTSLPSHTSKSVPWRSGTTCPKATP